MASIAKAVKTELIRRLATDPALHGVTVDYAWIGSHLDRRYVYGGRIAVTQNYAAMTSLRKPKDEIATVDIHVLVRVLGGPQEDADDQALALGAVLEDLIASDPQLGGAVPGLRWADVAGFELVPSLDDDSVYAEATYHVACHSRLF
jgi:hypothetical protein